MGIEGSGLVIITLVETVEDVGGVVRVMERAIGRSHWHSLVLI